MPSINKHTNTPRVRICTYSVVVHRGHVHCTYVYMDISLLQSYAKGQCENGKLFESDWKAGDVSGAITWRKDQVEYTLFGSRNVTCRQNGIYIYL